MVRAETGLTIAAPPHLADKRLYALYEYWLRLARGARGLPARESFDPMHLPRLLPYIWVIEVDGRSNRFRLRLAGEEINVIYGRNIGRKFFAEVFDQRDMATIVTGYKRALQEPAVFYAKGNVYADAGHSCAGERLGLPMLGDDGGTRILLGATVYEFRKDNSITLRPAGDAPLFHSIQAANHRRIEIAGG